MVELTEKTGVLPRVAIVVLAAGVFLLDVMTPAGIAIPMLYAAIVPISLWSRQRRDLLLVAIACTVLTALGFVFSPPGPVMRVALSNRLIGVVAIWAITILALQHRRTEKVVELLNQLVELLQACVTPEEAYAVITRIAPQLFPAEDGSLWAIRRSQNLVETVVEWPQGKPGERTFVPTECWALRSDRVYLVEDTRVGPLCNHLANPLPSTYICAPLMAQGETIGLLHLSHPPRRLLAQINRKLATTVAERIALALANLKLRAVLRSLSVRDPLTGLFNRRYMEESLQREVHRAARNQRTVGIIMLDLDHFKQFNETFGHDAGDALLREAGSVLQRSMRVSDIVCRYGGEEFTIIMPEASLAATLQKAEQLRTTVNQLRVQHHSLVLGPITFSLGVSLFPDHGSTGEAVLRAADAALYQAKFEGRDRVMMAESAEERLNL